MAERADKRAQWARVAARVREDVVSGRLGLGDRVGGEVALAQRYGVSRGVVQRALAQLREEGILSTVHGRGSYVAAVPVVRMVRVGPGDRVTARLPEDSEREELGMPAGIPVLVIARPGAALEVRDAAVTVITGLE